MLSIQLQPITCSLGKPPYDLRVLFSQRQMPAMSAKTMMSSTRPPRAESFSLNVRCRATTTALIRAGITTSIAETNTITAQ